MLKVRILQAQIRPNYRRPWPLSPSPESHPSWISCLSLITVTEGRQVSTASDQSEAASQEWYIYISQENKVGFVQLYNF